MSHESHDDVRWSNLLEWLAVHGMRVSPDSLLVHPKRSPGAGRGLFASRTIPPSTPLFAVPASALLSTATLSNLYPCATPTLTATQLISVHLWLHRPLQSSESLDPLFGPYISILPRPADFGSHPLTWLCKRNNHLLSLTIEQKLLASLPPSVMYSLQQVAARFYADCRTVQRYLKENPEVIGNLLTSESHTSHEFLEKDYLWAWLNVNTRCIYHRLKSSRSDPDNIVLCPILDFANHASPPRYTVLPRPSSAEIRNSPPSKKLGDDFVLLSPPGTITRPDDEMYLTYGAHSNRTLFTEYGFLNEPSPEDMSNGGAYGEVDLQLIVENLFKQRGRLGEWMKECLIIKGYWGDWTIHSSPAPAHPSFRLVTALRLYHLFPTFVTDIPLADDVLDPWHDTLLGQREIVSDENERLWRNSLLTMCESLVADAARQIYMITELQIGEEDNAVYVMRKHIKALWEEECQVASAVIENIRQEVQF